METAIFRARRRAPCSGFRREICLRHKSRPRCSAWWSARCFDYNYVFDPFVAIDALLTGGVASSQLLRDQICAINQKRRLGLRLYFGQRQYAGDNAAGVALIGRDRMMKEKL